MQIIVFDDSGEYLCKGTLEEITDINSIKSECQIENFIRRMLGDCVYGFAVVIPDLQDPIMVEIIGSKVSISA